MSQLRFITNVLYRLKRRYGNPVNLVRVVSESNDLTTGQTTRETDSLLVDRAIILPANFQREMFFDRAYMTDNKDFTYGGLVSTQMRDFVFDAKDLGAWILEVDQQLVYATKRYDIVKIQAFEENAGFLVTAKETSQLVVGNVISVSIYDDLLLDDVAESEVQ